jgi:hypothetical protein
LSNIDIRTQKFIDSISNNEEFTTALKSLIPAAISETNDTSFAYFTTAMIEYMRQNIKDDFRAVRAANSTTKTPVQKGEKAAKPTGNWRQEIENRFDGRGNVWVLIEKDMIAANLVAMRNAGIDCDDYENQINAHGKAWMRYMGTRMHPETNAPCALFWIWPAGSKGVVGKMDESAWVYVSMEDALNDEKVQLIGMTPYKAGFENNKPKNFGKKIEKVATETVPTETVATDTVVIDTASSDMANEVSANNDIDVPADSIEVSSYADELDDLENELFGN